MSDTGESGSTPSSWRASRARFLAEFTSLAGCTPLRGYPGDPRPCQDILVRPDYPDMISRVLLVRAVDRRRTRAGAPFLRLTLGDRASTLPAVLWDADAAALDLAQLGAPVQVTGRVEEHPRYGRQLTVETLAEPADVPWDELRDGPARPVAEIGR